MAAPGAADHHAAYGAAGSRAGGYGAAPAQQDYLPEYRTQPAAAAPAKPGSSGTLRLVLIVAAIAIVAVVAVWFFALRGPTTTGDEFVGTWTATHAEGHRHRRRSPRRSDAFTVTLSGVADRGQKVTVPAHLDGTRSRHHPGRLLTDGR